MQRFAWVGLMVSLASFSATAPVFAQLEPVVEEVCTTLGCEDFCPVCTPGVPNGTIVMWSGSLDSIPADWALCDGTNGTPDLRDRFVMGAPDGEEPGEAGGSNAHGHTSTPHAHSTATSAHSHGVNASGSTGGSGGHAHGPTGGPTALAQAAAGSTVQVAHGSHTHGTSSGGDHGHNFGFAVQSSSASASGSTETVSTSTDVVGHAPPFYTLAFIMKLP